MPSSLEPLRSLFVFRGGGAHDAPPGAVSHTEHGLTYLLRGRFRMEQGAVVEGRPGTLALVPAGVPHRALESEGMEYWHLGFCPTCLGLDEAHPLLVPFARVRRGAVPVLEVPEDRRAHLVMLFEALAEELARARPETPVLRRSLAQLILGEACRAMPLEAQSLEPQPAAAGSLVGEVLQVVQRRGLEPISLREVAAAVHRSPAHVAKEVKRVTGYSVGEWLTAVRIAEAEARLAHSDESLGQIAEAVGWKDKTHFIRQFRKARGVTPAAWRRAHRLHHSS